MITANLDRFEHVFGHEADIPFDRQIIDDIIRNRKVLENELFVDRLLKALGIDKASSYYPPHSEPELRELHKRISSTRAPDNQKQSLLYYIRKDFPNCDHQAAEELTQKFYLPEKYKILIDGLWLIDRLKFEKSLDYLTEPVLIPTFPEEILYTLCRHSSENNKWLPLAYFHTVSPSLRSSKLLEAFFGIFCRCSITEAFYFSRGQEEQAHQVLFEALIKFVLVDSTGDAKARRGVELIGLPFNDEEEVWFEAYLKDGKGMALAGAMDTLIMRGLAKGNSKALIEHGNNKPGRKIDGENWAILRESLHNGLGVEMQN